MPIRSDDAGPEPGPLPHLFRDAERLGVSVGRAATATPYSDCGAPLISTGIRRSLTVRHFCCAPGCQSSAAGASPDAHPRCSKC